MLTTSNALKITHHLSIPIAELQLSFSRSAGAGGQNVNKVNTKVTLHFDVAGSPSLSPEQKALISSRLTNKMTREGILYLSASEYRTQGDNREAALERFTNLMRTALAPPPKKRKPTRPSRKAVERRLDSKRKRAKLKQQRGKISS